MNPWLDTLSFFASVLALFALLACFVSVAEFYLSWRENVPRGTRLARALIESVRSRWRARFVWPRDRNVIDRFDEVQKLHEVSTLTHGYKLYSGKLPAGLPLETARPTPPEPERQELARVMTRADHLQIESEREPAQVQADFRRDIPADPATGLRFHHHMTLLAASRIAGERGFILSIEWSKLGGMKVTTGLRPAPHFLTQGKRHEI